MVESIYAFKKKEKWKSLSRFWLFAAPWTVAHKVPVFMAFPGQEYLISLPYPIVLQGTFLTEGTNLHLLHGRQIITVLPDKPINSEQSMKSLSI